MTIQEVPKQEPHKGEVVIQIKATGVNPSDVKNAVGYFKASFPWVPERAYASVVAIGKSAKAN